MEQWYAIYTRPRFEKRVHGELTEKGVHVYLPLQKVLKQWSDRRKWVQEPLFRSYLFVRIDYRNYLTVLKTDGVVKFIKFEGRPVVVPEVQILAVRKFIESGELMAGDLSQYTVGSRVEVASGSLKGLSGTLVDFEGKTRVRVQIEGIPQSLHLRIPVGYLKKISLS